MLLTHKIEAPSETEVGRAREAAARLSASPDSPSSPTDHSLPAGATVAEHVTELQKNLSEDFSKKLQEWERKRSGGQSQSRPPEPEPERPERRSRKEEVERQRKVTQVQHEEQLPAEFRRRLHEWERKQREGSGRRKRTDEGPEVRRKLTDGERRRGKQEYRETRSQMSPQAVEEEHLPAEFRKRLTEWEIAKALAGKSQQNVEQLQKNLPHEFNKKYEEWKLMKAGRLSPGCQKRRAAEVRRQTRTKDLQWLERELQKVEREKGRLEREREKYLDREARLERVRDAMRRPKEDKVTIKTAEGEFRFEGINKNFTKKLYEWEERRGIPPDSESSTIALLAPNYQPMDKQDQEAGRVARCKSEGSLAELASAALGQHSRQSSEDKTGAGLEGTLGDATKACSEPDLLMVDVEEVEATPLEDIPPVHAQEPVYSYAPEEVTRLIDSSGSDGEVPGFLRPNDDLLVTFEVPEMASGDPQQPEGTYSGLLDANITILDKLKQKEEVCRCLEEKLEEIGQNMISIQQEHKQELEKLRNQKTKLQPAEEGEGLTEERKLMENNLQLLESLQQRCNELQGTGDRLKEEREQIQASLQHHSDQQANLARHLVGNMRKLHAAGSSIDVAAEDSPPAIEEEPDATVADSLRVDEPERLVLPSPGVRRRQVDKKTVDKLQEISTDLLSQAKRLEKVLGPRQGKRPTRSFSQGHHSRAWPRTGDSPDWLRSHKSSWQPADWSALPGQLSRKVEELQREMLMLCTARGSGTPQSPSGSHDLSLSSALEEAAPSSDELSPEKTATFTFRLPVASTQEKAHQELDSLEQLGLPPEETQEEVSVQGDLMCPTTPEEATSPCSSSRSSVEDLGAAAKWRDKADLYTSYDQTLKEMQRELETVEADYALDRRRKSSDDVISTPSSYRSRSSSIPSSEDVDEPRLFQMVEQPEHLIEEEEDDIADSQSERSDWSASALRMRRQHASPSVSSACEERPFTAGATRTFEIPTVDTRSLSGLPPASNAPVLVAAQRTVYSVDEGLVKVTVREQAETPPPSPVADVTGTAEESVSLRPAPSEESDRLSSTTPTPTASPLLLRQTEVTGSRSPMRPSLSVTSQDSTPSAEGSEADSATPCEGRLAA
ncbi:uncharacterized protein LOC119104677 [Pollicipes pollicipes]|uniref:uncharacterized protein LOC119104677 n=1 Tax=Pollicipes pollicipes TaxID=41117 RepID=UPI001884A423|nr:uncharacterized protein LOC119104677 [Pollicipes pollicipes]